MLLNAAFELAVPFLVGFDVAAGFFERPRGLLARALERRAPWLERVDARANRVDRVVFFLQ
jgi:hypothetical protein